MAYEWKLFPHDQLFSTDKGKEPQGINLVVQAVHAELEKQRTFFKRKSLIIFDDASAGFILQKLNMQLPSNTDILVTSRDLSWPVKVSLSEEEHRLTEREGMDLLRQWVGEQRFDPHEAEKIVLRFNRLPAVIAQAGCYLDKSKTMEMKDYLPLFEASKDKILREGKHPNQPIEIVTSLKMLMNRLKQQDPRTLELLRFCAYIPGKNIPTDLLIQVLEIDHPQFYWHVASLGHFGDSWERKINNT